MKKKNPLMSLFVVLAFIIVGYGLGWAVCVGIMKLVTLCFGWSFSLAIATGIWLIICLLYLMFYSRKKG